MSGGAKTYRLVGLSRDGVEFRQSVPAEFIGKVGGAYAFRTPDPSGMFFDASQVRDAVRKATGDESAAVLVVSPGVDVLRVEEARELPTVIEVTRWVSSEGEVRDLVTVESVADSVANGPLVGCLEHDVVRALRAAADLLESRL